METEILKVNPNPKSEPFTDDVSAVIICMTDGEKPFILQTVESVLQNEGVGQVIICVEENNQWIDKKLSSEISHPLVEVYRLPMCTAGAARNHGVKKAKLPWVAFCDGDDVWCPEKIKTQRSYAKLHRCDVIGVDHLLTDEEGRVRAYSMSQVMPMTSSWMVRKDLLISYPFDEKITNGTEDSHWWTNLPAFTRKTRCPKMLLRYRVRKGSLSSDNFTKRRKALVITYANIPLIGRSVMVLSCIFWFLCRRKHYSK